MSSGMSDRNLTPVLIRRGHQMQPAGRRDVYVLVPCYSSLNSGHFSDLQRRSSFPPRPGDVLPVIAQRLAS